MRLLNIILLFVFFVRIAQSESGHLHSSSQEKTSVSQSKQAKEEARVAIQVPSEQQGKMGLKTTKAQKKVVEHEIRTVGTITADERSESHVHSKINGWIDRIHADYVGKPVKKGQLLYELYSPDLVSTQEEFLVARRQGEGGKEIASTALERLKLWNVPNSEIDSIVNAGKAKRAISFTSPASGFILNKVAIQGMYITPEMELYHIADLSRIWIVVTLYEYDVAIIQVGDEVQIQLPYDPNKTLTAKLSYIYPNIDVETRTGKARIELENKTMSLKPGMFANVQLKKKLGEAVVVPDDSIIDTGARKIIFVKVDSEKFEPREVKVGPRVDNSFTVLSGLSDGEEVVTSAHFLIDAESKFQAALQTGVPLPGHTGHGTK